MPQKVAAPGDNEAQTSEHGKRGGKDPYLTEERGMVGSKGALVDFGANQIAAWASPCAIKNRPAIQRTGTRSSERPRGS